MHWVAVARVSGPAARCSNQACYTGCYTSPEFSGAFEPLPRFERGTYGLRKGCEDLGSHEASRIDDNAITTEANRHASTRIDKQAYDHFVLVDILAAQAAWITRRDRKELRRTLLAIALRLDL